MIAITWGCSPLIMSAIERIHPLQDLQTFAALARHDAAEHRGRLVVAQRTFEDFFDVVARAQAQAGLLLERDDKFVEHHVDSLLRQISHGDHRAAQRLDFFGVHEADDFRGLLLTEQQHQHGSALCAAQAFQFLLELFGHQHIGHGVGRAGGFDFSAFFAFGGFVVFFGCHGRQSFSDQAVLIMPLSTLATRPESSATSMRMRATLSS